MLNRRGGPFDEEDARYLLVLGVQLGRALEMTTLPAQLVESELFGHERGAFTGADRRVPGRLEVANGGTVLLDEIGDLPSEMQGKLLRFMQERRFERVGGRTPLQADVRVICATHRDLEKAVRAGEFREDLYYRIRVVEVVVPPLRERGAAEIEELACHFAALYAKRYGRPEPRFTRASLASLAAHTWPGNLRELEHWIESAVVLSTDGTIGEHRSASMAPPGAGSGGQQLRCPLGLSLAEVNRRYIATTVQACDGNKTEAARRLGVGRNTVSRALSHKKR